MLPLSGNIMTDYLSEKQLIQSELTTRLNELVDSSGQLNSEVIDAINNPALEGDNLPWVSNESRTDFYMTIAYECVEIINRALVALEDKEYDIKYLRKDSFASSRITSGTKIGESPLQEELALINSVNDALARSIDLDSLYKQMEQRRKNSLEISKNDPDPLYDYNFEIDKELLENFWQKGLYTYSYKEDDDTAISIVSQMSDKLSIEQIKKQLSYICGQLTQYVLPSISSQLSAYFEDYTDDLFKNILVQRFQRLSSIAEAVQYIKDSQES